MSVDEPGNEARPPDPVPPEQGTPDHDLGILVVHGIGEQPRGDTLVRFGEPLLRWIERWIGTPDRVCLVEAHLDPEELEPGRPAHFVTTVDVDESAVGADVALRAMAHAALVDEPVEEADPGVERAVEREGDAALGPGPRGRQRWMVAESWWARDFRRPAFGTFAKWLLSRGPWVIFSHYGGNLRDASGWGRLPAFLWLLLSLPLALLTQVLVAVLALLALIPWPGLRDLLSGLLLKLTGTIGDSYVVIESPTQRAAAVTQVRSDLGWLSEQCAEVAVIAHSQGAAIAREALAASPRSPSLFVTFGQGLRKLEELKETTASWGWLFSAASFSLPITVLLAALSFFPPPGMDPESIGTARYFLLAYPGFLLLQVVLSAVRGTGGDRLNRLGLAPATRWVDFFTRQDPVPGGPLEGRVPGVISREVHNRASTIADHTSYWENEDQFVGSLVCELDRRFGMGISVHGHQSLLQAVARKRPRRVRALAVLRWAAWLSVPVAAYGLRSQLAALGRLITDPLVNAPFVGASAKLLLGVAAGIEELVLSTVPGAEATPSGHGTIAIALISVAVLGLYALTARLWRTWDALAIRPLFTRVTPGQLNEQKLVALFVVLLGLVPLAVAVSTLFVEEIGDLKVFLWEAVWTAPMLPMALFGIAIPLILLWGLAKLIAWAYRGLRDWLSTGRRRAQASTGPADR